MRGGLDWTSGVCSTDLATSGSFTPTSTGTWCFRGEYGGNANYQSSFDGSATECFVVTKASTPISTTPADHTPELHTPPPHPSRLPLTKTRASPTRPILV